MQKMVGRFQVVLADLSKSEFDALLVYHTREYGRNNATKLVVELQALTELLAEWPQSKPLLYIPGRKFKYEYRRAYLLKTYTVIYRVDVVGRMNSYEVFDTGRWIPAH